MNGWFAWGRGAFLGLLALLLAMTLPSGAFGLVFLLQGAYLVALGLATTTYLLDLAPPEERSASISLTNSTSGLFAFSTVIWGYLSDWLGFPALFLLAALFYALALYASKKFATLSSRSVGSRARTEGGLRPSRLNRGEESGSYNSRMASGLGL